MLPDVPVAEDSRVRLRAGIISLVVSVVLLGAKYQAYLLTGSTAILSDALESIVNVVAAVFALGGLIFAGRPADRNHPYGHGKIEFFSAAFEGGLIAFAAVVIIYEVVQSLIRGVAIRQLESGLVIVLGAGLVNLALGWFLLKTGRKHASLTLVADGQHVLSDFYTSAGIVVGLLLVRATGVSWLDPLVAGVVALNLMWTGARLVRHAAGGLLDEEDTALLDRLLEVLRGHVGQGVIRVHHLRAIRAGRFHHVDAHLVVPEFWPVDRSEGNISAIQRRSPRSWAPASRHKTHTQTLIPRRHPRPGTLEPGSAQRTDGRIRSRCGPSFSNSVSHSSAVAWSLRCWRHWRSRNARCQAWISARTAATESLPWSAYIVSSLGTGGVLPRGATWSDAVAGTHGSRSRPPHSVAAR